MESPIRSLHHVTATADDAQADLDFCTGTLALRLVKRTVNFDNHNVYHFYYGNESGAPGTIWTTFPYKGWGVPAGTKGAGQITETSFSAPVSSLPLWRARLAERSVQVEDHVTAFGEEALVFTDSSGLNFRIIGSDADERTPWTRGGVPGNAALRGLHGVTLTLRAPGATLRLMTELLGFQLVHEAKGRLRLAVNGDQPGKLIEIVPSSDAPPARNGTGTVHHVAFAISSEDEQRQLRDELLRAGYHVTEVLDRNYFRSIYFREPGGVLFEVATVPPGFTVDEELPMLGCGLKLPPWEEANRTEIESTLPTIRVPS